MDDIKNTFIDSLKKCLADYTKRDDLREILEMLETECNFLSTNYKFELDIDKLALDDLHSAEMFFNQLSAGHKVVLSIIARCIDVLVTVI